MLRVNMSINIIAMVEPKQEGARDKSIAECVPLNFHQANITENYTESLSKHTALPDVRILYYVYFINDLILFSSLGLVMIGALKSKDLS